MWPDGGRGGHQLLRFDCEVCKFERSSVLSHRVTGAVHSMRVQALEEACIEASSYLRAIVSGALLFCVFACIRWSDCARIEKCWCGASGFLTLLEAETSKHKTSRRKEDKARLLPFTVLGNFDCQVSWAKCFVEARKAAKIDKLGFLIPSWNDRACGWSNTPMTSAEATCFLREMLEEPLGATEAARFSSRSCKATLLTWAGVTDVCAREERT